ncbi:5' exonuclease Apollo [Spatholobus suberectus]|nr:5' exonuclease Apollo [Spatholobus suberectus]
MPIEMPKGLPFSVDTWTPSSSKRHYFLTHAHKDHSSSITSHSSFPIYSTLVTKTILLQQYPQLDASLFLPIEVGQSKIIDDPTGAFTATAFDANHCPGAVMFLFEGKFGNILHTGDCRLTPECLLNLPDKYVGRKGKEPRCPLDCVFLDCTFGNFSRGMPSKHSAIQQVINCIWKHPDALTVYLTCNILGQEEILVNVSQTFGAKIYVDKAKYSECFENLALTVSEILCEDPSSRFHLFDGSRRLYERAKAKLVEAKATLQPEPLIVRPSAQWYACEEKFSDIENTRKKRMDEAVKDQFGVWHVCYSMHSSKEELEWALELLAPRWVVSTTPSCRALELDYVKKHCFNSEGALNNSMWKLLDVNLETSDDVDASDKSVSCNSVLEETPSLVHKLNHQSNSALRLKHRKHCLFMTKACLSRYLEEQGSLSKMVAFHEEDVVHCLWLLVSFPKQFQATHDKNS